MRDTILWNYLVRLAKLPQTKIDMLIINDFSVTVALQSFHILRLKALARIGRPVSLIPGSSELEPVSRYWLHKGS